MKEAGVAVTVCIATYRRAERLAALLDDLQAQTRPPEQIVVVDNDPAGSARAAVEAHRLRPGAPPLAYDIQPEKSISLTRNRCVAHARGDWLAFLDDDERVVPHWLGDMLETAARCRADGVLGPVVPVLPGDAPAWIRRGRFYDGPRLATGARVPDNLMRIGNALIDGARLRREDPVFDPAYGLTGGEDGDLLLRLVRGGALIVWCDSALATEPVEPARLNARWILMRALRGGQDYARHFRKGRLAGGPPSPARRAAFNLRALAQMAAAALLALAALPLGRHRALAWLARACANYGKLSVLWGRHYREYA